MGQAKASPYRGSRVTPEDLEFKRSQVRRWVTFGVSGVYFGALAGIVGHSLWQNDYDTAFEAIKIMGGPALLIIGFWFGGRKPSETPS